MTFAIGCAIWAFKGWVGELFPSESRASDFLRLYAQRFLTVEGNTTFYSIPNAETVQRWAADTPEAFQFCLKLPRSFTHSGLLQPQHEPIQRFVEQMQGLGTRLGPLFAQLPPSYSPAYLADLEAFLAGLPHDRAEFALEVRHPDWFKPLPGDRLTQLLEQFGVGRVLLDSRPIYEVPDDPQLRSERKKPHLPLQPSLTAPFSLIRYISHPEMRVNQPFMETWLPLIDAWLRQGKRIYLFVHCPIEARSPANARYFQQQLEAFGAPVPPLPWNNLEQFPAQLSLF